MTFSYGVLFAVIALIGWGIGDFLIQRSTRTIGNYKSLFVIAVVGLFGIFPFVYSEIPNHTLGEYASLTLLSLIIFVYAITLFEALRIGKISVVEPIVAVELPLTVGLGVFIAGESLTLIQFLLFITTFFGIAFTVAKKFEHLHFHKKILEKGVAIAFLASILSAIVNFYIGTSAKEISPLMIVWFTHAMLAFWCGLYILYKREYGNLFEAIKESPVSIIGQGVFDNIAWIAFAFAASIIPISIATSISESYIVLAALLGYLVGREKLSWHQKTGAVIAIVSVVMLASTV
ncbi:MAG: EamA family transporter [Patescibacteria group bacterium]